MASGTPSAMAQLAPTTVPAGATVNIATAAPAAPRSLWNFFGISRAGHAACKERLCNSQIGQMMNNAIAPISGVTGGLIPQFCSTVPTAADVAALAAGVENGTVSPAVAAAAKIKAEEADAKARVAAVEYLGTVDCNYFPSAQKGILTALRTDTNECVRYAAARVLSNGCCCSKDTIDNLTITVMGLAAVKPNGKTPDENPPETSERVRCAAMIALQHCLASLPPDPVDETIPPEVPEGPVAPEATPPLPEGPTASAASLLKTRDTIKRTAYLKALNKKPMAAVVRDANRALAIFTKLEQAPFTTGRRTLANAINRARVTPAAPTAVAANAPAPANTVPQEADYPQVNPELATPTETVVEDTAPDSDPGVLQPQPPASIDPAAPMELPPLPPDMDLDEAEPSAPETITPPVAPEAPAVPDAAPASPSSELLTLPPATEARRPAAAPRPVASRAVASPRMGQGYRPQANRPIAASYTPAQSSYTAAPSTPGYDRFTRDSSAYRYDPMP